MMKFAYSSNAFTRTDLESALKDIAKLGFSAAEILCDRPHWFPGEVSENEIDHIAQLLKELNLSVSNLNANTANGYYKPIPAENTFEPALSNEDPTMRQWRQDYTVNTIKLAQRLDASCISITTGRPTPGCSPSRALNYFADEVNIICDAAARFDIRIGIEYEPGLILENAEEVMAFIEHIDSPHLGVNLDIGHSYLNHEPPTQTIEMFSNRIWNVHLEDIKGNKHFHLIPGEGDMPFEEYLTALRKINYQEFLTLELYSYPERPIEAGRLGLEYLTDLQNNLPQ